MGRDRVCAGLYLHKRTALFGSEPQGAEVFLQNLPADFVPYWISPLTTASPIFGTAPPRRFLPVVCWNWHSMWTTPRPRETSAAARTIVRSLYDHIFCMTLTAWVC